MENKKKENFLLYHNIFPTIEELENEDVGDVLKSIFKYSINSEITEYEKGSTKSLLFKAIKNSIDINNEKYVEKCRKNKENILKRWKKIFYDNQLFNKENFESYCIEKHLEENFDDIIEKQKNYVDNQDFETLKEEYNCNLISNETILKNFT